MGTWDMAPEDRPREKLLSRGAEVLGTNELLAVVLGTGTHRLSALRLANEILSSAGGLTGLAHLSPNGLARLKGLKTARTARLVAALELGRRMLTEPSEPRPTFRTPDDVGKYLLPRFGAKPVEEFRLADTLLPFEATASDGAVFITDSLAGKRTLLKFFRGGW